MALLEELQRKIHKYGLVPKLIGALPFISFLCAIVGASWLFVLPLEGQFRRTYISENALMPSQAYSYYRESEWNYLRGYRDEIHNHCNDSLAERNRLVYGFLSDIGYSASIHHLQSNKQKRAGTDAHFEKNGNNNDNTTTQQNTEESNLYGILNAPRGEGTEAMVLVAPWITADGQFNENGVSLVISLARYFARWTVWSKNIIVVFPANNNVALRSWVKAYHSTLDLTAGSIEAALVVEYPGDGDYYDYLEILYEGVNGQLPNLDLLNTAVSISEHEGMKVSLQHVEKDKIHDESYLGRLAVLLNGVKELTLAGLKNSNGCEVFSGYRIQAITLRAMGDNGGIDITTLGRVVEAVFRSVNNLLEKFHQSFFFYLMLAPRQFISIGTYLPSAVLLSVAFALASLSQVLNSKLSIQNHILKSATKVILVFLSTFAFATIFGSLVLYIPVPPAFIYYTLLLNGLLIVTLPTKQVLLAKLSTLLSTPTAAKNSKQNSILANIGNPLVIKASTAYLLHAVALLYTSMIITSILVVHFSLAYTMSLCMLPLTFIRPIISTKSSKWQHHYNSLSLLLSCPWFVVFLVGLLDLDFRQSNGGAAEGGPIEVMRGLLGAWRDFDSWTWFIVIVGWLPAWIASAISGSLIIDESEYREIIMNQYQVGLGQKENVAVGVVENEEKKDL